MADLLVPPQKLQNKLAKHLQNRSCSISFANRPLVRFSLFRRNKSCGNVLLLFRQIDGEFLGLVLVSMVAVYALHYTVLDLQKSNIFFDESGSRARFRKQDHDPYQKNPWIAPFMSRKLKLCGNLPYHLNHIYGWMCTLEWR